jgi:ferric-dicitrate binding protein FerR (iron transport regulator)
MTEEKIHILIVKYLTKEASANEEEELLAWLSQSEENRQCLRSMKDAHDLGQFETCLKGSNTAVEWDKLLRRIKPAARPIRTISPFRKVLRYAAIFVLGLLCMKIADTLPTQKPVVKGLVTRIETGKGERSKITLPDSSVVWLNACSAISYPQQFGDTERQVDMEGEAYFEVRTNAARPFVVHADSLTYCATGTSFNVYSFDSDHTASLVLVEGSVTLRYGSYRTEVKPGELIEIDKTARKISRQQTNTALYTGWRYGDLMFEKMTFEELTKRLERNFKVTFVFENEQMKKESFGGTFRHYDSLETILKVISTSTPVKYKIEKGIVYIR